MNEPRLILASQSERRMNILRQLGLNFHQEFKPVDEQLCVGEKPMDFTLRLAETKVKAVLDGKPGTVVLGADTVVAVRKHILGKPADRENARQMLRILSGTRHRVITGICLWETSGQRHLCRAAVTEVAFAPLSEREIESYLDTGEPMDKAGAYGIQERGSLFVREIRGCYFNVVGFPVRLFYEAWQELLPSVPLPFRSNNEV